MEIATVFFPTFIFQNFNRNFACEVIFPHAWNNQDVFVGKPFPINFGKKILVKYQLSSAVFQFNGDFAI